MIVIICAKYEKNPFWIYYCVDMKDEKYLLLTLSTTTDVAEWTQQDV